MPICGCDQSLGGTLSVFSTRSDEDHQLVFQQNDAERNDTYLSPEGAVPAYVASYINNTTTTAAQLPAVSSIQPANITAHIAD